MESLSKMGSKFIRHLILAMYNKNPFWHFMHMTYPLGQMVAVGMTADTRQINNLSFDPDSLTEQLDLLGAMQQIIAQRSRYLIADKQDRTLRPPQIMFQMMANTTGLTHAGCGKDNLRLHIKIDALGIITCNRSLEPVETYRILSASDHFHGFFPEAFEHIAVKDCRCLDSQRTVHIDFKIRICLDHVFFLDPAQMVQHLLCTANGKGRNNHIATAAEGLFEKLCHQYGIVRRGLMVTVAVGRFDNKIVSGIRPCRILDQRTVAVTKIAGKDYFCLLTILSKPKLDKRRPEQMPGITEPYL